MSNSYPAEERYPLLLLFLEDGQRLSKQHKKIVIDKNRYQGITSGATAVITQWPGHLTTCWLTSLLIGLMLAFIAMMMFMLSVHPHVNLLSTICKGNRMYVKENNSITVHLVHGPNPWLQSQLEFLEQIAKNYNQVAVELISIQNENEHNCTNHHTNFLRTPAKNTSASSSSSTSKLEDETSSTSASISTIKPKLDQSNTVKRLKRNISKRRPILIRRKRFQFSINIGSIKLLKMLLGKKVKNDNVPSVETESPLVVRTIKTLDGLLDSYPNIYVTNLTYEEVFKASPLRYNWKNLNEVTKLFAIRVLQMWNHGGIAFEIPDYTLPNLDSLNVSLQDQIDDNVKKFKKLVTIGLTTFKNLPDGLVTVDDEGYHMETKTICHAFFGEILMSIKKAQTKTMPNTIIKDALTLFCKRGAVDADYCQNLKD